MSHWRRIVLAALDVSRAPLVSIKAKDLDARSPTPGTSAEGGRSLIEAIHASTSS
jgi:hypothetical protein